MRTRPLSRLLGPRFAGKTPRRDPRFLTEGLLTSPAGTVINLSSSGMQLRSDRKPHLRKGDVEIFSIHSDAKRLALHAKVVWVRRTSPFAKTYDVGLRFLDTRPELRETLRSMAQHGFMGGSSGPARHASTGPGRTRVIEADLEVEDLYALLGVRRDATQEQIRAAYRKLATQLHPDVSDDPDAEERFVLVNKAYRILRSPDVRRRYDDMLDNARNAA
jgi:DnaJ domain/PilZ domain